MKQLLSILIFCAFTLSVHAQCYQPLRAEGQALMRQKDYEEAINRYLAALSCPDRPRNDDLPQLIKAALRARVEELEAARRETEVALAQARSAALAAKARQIYPDDQTVGLLLAGAAYRLDPGGREAVEALRDFFDNRQLHLYRRALRHDDYVEDLDFAPDGRTLVTVSLDSTARLWDLEGNLLHTFPHPTGINCVAFAPDGAYFLTGAEDELVRKWSPAGVLLATFDGFAGGQEGLGITALSVMPDGTAFFAGTYGGPLKLLTPQGEVLTEVPRLQVSDIVIAPDNQSFAYTGGDHQTYLINPGADTAVVLRGHESYPKSIHFSRDGQFLLTAAQDRTARLWNRRGEQLAVFREHEGSVRDALFGPDGQVITAGSDNRIRFFDQEGNLLKTLHGHGDLVDQLALSPDGKTLASGSFDHTVKLWPLEGTGMAITSALPGSISRVAWLPGSGHFIVGGADNQTIVRDETGQVTAELTGVCLTLSPDGQQLLTGYEDTVLRLFDRNGQSRASFPAGAEPLMAAAFSPDGQTILGLDSRGMVYRWDRSGALTETFQSPVQKVYSAVFTPDAGHVFICDPDGVGRFWEVGNKTTLNILPEEGRFFSQIGLSPDGRYLLTGSSNGIITAWDREGKVVRRFEGLFDGITSIHCTPDLSHILASCILGPVRIWEFDSGREVQSVYPLHWFAAAAAFSPDGQQLLIGDSKGGARIFPRWDVLVEEILPPLTKEQRADFGVPAENE